MLDWSAQLLEKYTHIKEESNEKEEQQELKKANIIDLDADQEDNSNRSVAIVNLKKRPKIDANFLLPMEEIGEGGGVGKPERMLKRLPKNMVYMRD